MHYLTFVGLIVIAFGTFLTYLGQQIKSDESTKDLKTTIEAKDEKIESLTKEVQLISESDKLKEANRNLKIKDVAFRAKRLLSESDLFYAFFLLKHSSKLHQQLMESNFTKHELPDDEIIKKVTQVFMSTTMLEASRVFKNKNVPVSEFEYFFMQISKIYSEADTILQHYGDVDHELIHQIEDIRNRSKMLVEVLSLLPSAQGGIKNVFGKGVPDQYAGFFAYHYLAIHKCDIICKKLLAEK